MEQKKQPVWATWALAVVAPILAGGAAWFLAAATISVPVCQTGGGGGGVAEVVGFFVLVLAAPVAIVGHSRRVRPLLARVAVPVVISIILSLPMVFLGLQIWWSAHNCYT